MKDRLSPKVLDDLVYIQMNTMMMEKFNSLEVRDMLPINLEKLDGPIGLEDPLKLDWLDENNSQGNEETSYANENVNDLSWFTTSHERFP